MENLLFKKYIRKMTVGLFKKTYHTSDKYNFKEKIYMYLYRYYKDGTVTYGELEWRNRLCEIDKDAWDEIESEFNVDLIEFERSSDKKQL